MREMIEKLRNVWSGLHAKWCQKELLTGEDFDTGVISGLAQVIDALDTMSERKRDPMEDAWDKLRTEWEHKLREVKFRLGWFDLDPASPGNAIIDRISSEAISTILVDMDRLDPRKSKADHKCPDFGQEF